MDSKTPYSRAEWSWPADMNLQAPTARAGPSVSASSGAQTNGSSSPSSNDRQESQHAESQGRKRQKHYKPRTCRICLEVVQPTTEMQDSATGFFAPQARVRYVSEDPELGRLISPCKCKGSQKYVHEGCLQAWRQAAPLSDRNYWSCPTCKFKYRLQRLRWGQWLSSWVTRAALTIAILVVTVFVLGFVADPIINLWIDPLGSVTEALTDLVTDIEGLRPLDVDEPATWSYHFLKGVFSLGLLGFLKTLLAMSPWHWFRWGPNIGGGRRNAGRERLQQINWALVAIGVLTFMGATWKLVNHFSRRMLESANDMVVDIQGDDDDEEEEEHDDDEVPVPGTAEETRKDM